MPKRIARFLPNGRDVHWGLSLIDGRVTAIIAEGEKDVVRIELNEWLDAGESVASSALTNQSGVTITKTNNTTSVDLTVSAVTSWGYSDLTVTTSTGRIKVVPLGFATAKHASACDPYRRAFWYG